MTVPPYVILIATMGLLGAQAALMFVDELVFHRRRGLSRFESWGHPVDSLVFLAALVVPAMLNPDRVNLVVYAALAVISTLVITKDEWIHAEACEPAEHWLHAMLFVLHAPILVGYGMLWVAGEGAFLRVSAPLLVSGFMFYQLAYWVLYHDWYKALRRPERQQRVLRRPGRQVV